MNKILLDEVNKIINEDNEEKVYDVEKDSIVTIINEKNVDNEYEFNIKENAFLKLNIFDACKKSNRKITINLNGKNSKVEVNLSTISLLENSYDVDIYHKNINTVSQTNMHGLAIDDNKIYFKNNGHVLKGSIKSDLSQDNKIILMGENNSKIEPNLFIDEYDVNAAHGAFIGKFYDDEIFYLMSRGLSEKESYNLLVNGFLLEGFSEDKEEIEKIIKKYWR